MVFPKLPPVTNSAQVHKTGVVCSYRLQETKGDPNYPYMMFLLPKQRAHIAEVI